MGRKNRVLGRVKLKKVEKFLKNFFDLKLDKKKKQKTLSDPLL